MTSHGGLACHASVPCGVCENKDVDFINWRFASWKNVAIALFNLFLPAHVQAVILQIIYCVKTARKRCNAGNVHHLPEQYVDIATRVVRILRLFAAQYYCGRIISILHVTKYLVNLLAI